MAARLAAPKGRRNGPVAAGYTRASLARGIPCAGDRRPSSGVLDLRLAFGEIHSLGTHLLPRLQSGAIPLAGLRAAPEKTASIRHGSVSARQFLPAIRGGAHIAGGCLRSDDTILRQSQRFRTLARARQVVGQPALDLNDLKVVDCVLGIMRCQFLKVSYRASKLEDRLFACAPAAQMLAEGFGQRHV